MKETGIVKQKCNMCHIRNCKCSGSQLKNREEAREIILTIYFYLLQCMGNVIAISNYLKDTSVVLYFLYEVFKTWCFMRVAYLNADQHIPVPQGPL